MISKKQKINSKNLNNISEDLLIYILGFLDIDEIKILMNIDNFFNNFIDFNEIIWREKLKYYHKNRYILKITNKKYKNISWKKLFKKSYGIIFKNGLIFYRGGYYIKKHKSLHSSNIINKTKEIIFYGHGTLYYENGNKKYKGGYKEAKFHGKGTSYYKNGNTYYDGEWEYGKSHGHGIGYY